jgi:hypothetical protein
MLRQKLLPRQPHPLSDLFRRFQDSLSLVKSTGKTLGGLRRIGCNPNPFRDMASLSCTVRSATRGRGHWTISRFRGSMDSLKE